MHIRSASIVLLFLVLFPGIAMGAVADWQKGATLTPWGPNDFGQPWLQSSIKNLAAVHANFVALVIPYEQSSLTSTDLEPGPHTPTDASLISAITYAHSVGLQVALKPHAQVAGSNDWRAMINPPDRTAWFKAYGDMLMHYAKLAQDNHVEEIVLGTELIDMTDPSVDPTNTQNWENLIGQVREVYSGKLTYSANWGPAGIWNDEKDHIQFWQDLDYIGVSTYVPLIANSGNYTQAEINSNWDNWNNQVQALSSKYNKPVIFTEVGYRSNQGALQQPSNWDPGTNYAPQEQSDGYTSLFTYWDQKPYMAGAFLWDWENDPNAGGAGDTGFTTQNKPAQAIVNSWFGGGAPIGDITAFASNFSVNPAAPGLNEEVSVSASAKNEGSGIHNANIDLEVTDKSGAQVFQKMWTGVDLPSGGSFDQTVAWTPTVSGTYTVNMGVFSTDWQTAYFWKTGPAITVYPFSDPNAHDIVIYAADATNVVGGDWSLVSDGTAASSTRLYNPNKDVAKLLTPLKNPSSYAEFTFTAPANVPYHLWMRMKAENDDYNNDSVHVQFSDAMNASGTSDFKIGTQSSMPVILEEGHNAFDSGWGWNDDNYGALGDNITFATGGTHTIRIQAREDGVSIDQILLSPAQYLSNSPGLFKRDVTILAKPDALANVSSSVQSSDNSSSTSTGASASSTPPGGDNTSTSTPSIPPAAPTSTDQTLPSSTTDSAPQYPLHPTLDLWWPVDHAVISGIQPVKAMLGGWPADSYKMFWQVDGDRLNPMDVSQTDWPHKEAAIDVSGWTWRGDNDYLLRFSATDNYGTSLAERSIVVRVVH